MIRLLHSTSVRLALIFAGLFIVASLVLGGVLWWETEDYLERETDAVILADTQAIGDRLRDFGLPGAVETINDRVVQTADEHAIYLFVDPALRRLAGNLSAWPAVVGPDQGWYQAALERNGRTYPARLLHVGLPGGFQLLVGRDVQSRVAVRARIVDALAWTALAALVLAIGGGLVVRRAVLSRVAQVNRTTEAIVQGDLSRRLSVGASDDEFGRLARTINEMLAQIELLIDGVRNASNAIAHDLRTPLAELRARLEAIDRRLTAEAHPNADLRSAIQDAVADVDRLVDVFNALLRLAAIEFRGTPRWLSRCRTRPAGSPSWRSLWPPAEAKGATFTVDTTPEELSSRAIPTCSPRRSAICSTTRSSMRPAREIALLLGRGANGNVAITVADSGPGIPESERDKVVERFHRGDAARTSPGLGLGLAEVSAVAKLHGGALNLTDNAPGLRATLLLRKNVQSGA